MKVAFALRMADSLKHKEPPIHSGHPCHRHGFSEASHYLWRGKFGGMSVPDGKRLKEREAENTRLKKRLAGQVFENAAIKDARRKKWRPRLPLCAAIGPQHCVAGAPAGAAHCGVSSR